MFTLVTFPEPRGPLGATILATADLGWGQHVMTLGSNPPVSLLCEACEQGVILTFFFKGKRRKRMSWEGRGEAAATRKTVLQNLKYLLSGHL